MLNVGINMTVITGHIAHFLGDSFTEQVAAYSAPARTTIDKRVPVGWPIGVSVGSLALVAAAVWLGVYVVHQRRRNMLQQVELTALQVALQMQHLPICRSLAVMTCRASCCSLVLVVLQRQLTICADTLYQYAHLRSFCLSQFTASHLMQCPTAG